MRRRFMPLAAAALLLAGCSTVVPRSDRGPPEPEFAGRMMTVVAANGQASTMMFDRDGTVRAVFGTRETVGRWHLDADDGLCFTWAGNYTECWPYEAPFERRETRTLTSNRGNVVRVTLQ
jgi:uncharacterized protein YceK